MTTDVPVNFQSTNFSANPLNILVHVQLGLLCFHNTYQFKVLPHLLPFGRNFKEEFCRIPNLGGFSSQRSVRGSGVVSTESPSMTSQYFSIQSFALSATVFPQFQCQFLPTPIRPPLGVMVDLVGRKWYQLKCRPHVDFYSRYTLSCTVWPQYTTRPKDDRQCDRNRPLMLQHRRPNKNSPQIVG